MLAHVYDPEKNDPTGWLMSEKLDGVRCYYDGVGKLYTRTGNPFYVPDWWKKNLPKIAMDGELWTGRDDFQRCVSIVRKQDLNISLERRQVYDLRCATSSRRFQTEIDCG